MKLIKRVETFADWKPLLETRHKESILKIASEPGNKAILESGGSIWISQFGGLSRTEIKLAP